jgi:serine/threonine protein kinase
MIMTDLSTVLLSNTADPSCGTVRWMSPELLDPTRFDSDGLPSRESDCYALGMAIYEVNRALSLVLESSHLPASRYFATARRSITYGLPSLDLRYLEGSVRACL